MSEEFDVNIDSSSDIDLDSELSSDASAFESEDIADIPDSIDEDIPESLSTDVVPDDDPGLDYLQDSIEEDVSEFSDDIGSVEQEDVSLGSESQNIEFNTIPEDAQDVGLDNELGSVDDTYEIPDDVAEDEISIDGERFEDAAELDLISEDMPSAEDLEEENQTGIDIPEDVDSGDNMGNTSFDKTDETSVDTDEIIDEIIAPEGVGTTLNGEEVSDLDNTDSVEEDIEGSIQDSEGITEEIPLDSQDESIGDTAKGDDILETQSKPETTPLDELSAYMNEHNYGVGDYGEYSQDPEWQRLHEAAFPDWEGRSNADESLGVRDNILDSSESDEMKNGPATAEEFNDVSSEETPFQQLSNYMNEHNYGVGDYGEYSQDPEWQRLHDAAFPDSVSEITNPSNDGIYHSEYHQVDDWMNRETADVSPSTESPNTIIDTSNADSVERGSEIQDMISGQEILERFGIEQHMNGSDWFVKGDHYDQFEKDYYSPDDYSYVEYDRPQERTISPSLIEGIHLGRNEVESPDIFWEQHMKGGTAESFQEIASHIPEVRERLAVGDTLDGLMMEDKLSKCVNLYYRNMPEVVERDGYYEFNSNGRHRILAARALGYDIPVKVVGTRKG